jgi:hypothetical protein
VRSPDADPHANVAGMFTRILAGSAVIAFFAVVAISVAALQDREGPRAGVLAGRSAEPTTADASTTASASQSGLLTRRPGSRPGYDRITSVDGGWSFEIPTAWSAESAPMRGGDVASFDLRAAALSGNAPAADQLRMRVYLAVDYDVTPLETFGARDVPQWLVVGQTRTTVSGRDAVRTVKNAYVPAGSPFDFQHVVWDFRSPFFADRIVAVDAWPANSPLAVEAERAMTTFQLSAPPPVVTSPKISRPVATARATEYAGALGIVSGSTAKLVLFKEYERAQIDDAKRIGGPYAMGGSTDPDQLVWIVVVKGDFEQRGVSRPPGPPGIGATYAPPPKLVWLSVIVNAIDGNVLNYVPGTLGEGPVWFGGLTDRAR